MSLSSSNPFISVTGVASVAQGGTNNTSLPVTAGGVLSSDGSKLTNVGAGTSGQVLQSNGASAPTWVTPGNVTLQYFASSQVTTDSSGISAATFTTFSNSPALSFTPTITGKYRVYCNIPVLNDTATGLSLTRIIKTSGTGTLLQESQGLQFANTAAIANTISVQSVYTLTSGVAYVFDIQGRLNSGAGNVLNKGSLASFYMFAELCG